MGATGYIGGRLVPRLVDAGHDVRCLTRRPPSLADVAWAGSVEVVRGDALDRDSLDAAMTGVDLVYYLVHSIGTGRDFEASDRRAAVNTAAAMPRRDEPPAPTPGSSVCSRTSRWRPTPG